MKNAIITTIVLAALALPAVAGEQTSTQQDRIQKLEAKVKQLDEQISAELDTLSKAVGTLQKKVVELESKLANNLRDDIEFRNAAKANRGF